MSRAERGALEANMPRLKAKKRLDEYVDGKTEMHPDTLFDVALEATGSEEVANAYRVAAIRATWKPT